MSLYCICFQEFVGQLDGLHKDTQNLLGPYDDETDFRMVVLRKQMKKIKTGATRVVLLDGTNLDQDEITAEDIKKILYRQTVDVYCCEVCKTIIVKEC